MSWFLRNLWTRTTQSAPVLERRRPALFEPVMPWVLPRPDIHEISVESAAQAPPPPTRLIPVDEAPAAAARGATREGSTVRQSARETAAQAVPTVVKSGPAASSWVASEDPVSSTDLIQVATKQRAAANPVDPYRAATPRARDELPPAASAPNRSSLSPNSASDAPSSRPGPRTSALPDAAASLEKRGQESEVVGTLVPTAPRIAQAIQLAKVAQAQVEVPFAGAEPDTKGSVQITIGRVEVRAVTGGERPAVRVAKGAAPRLTLNDYLRERKGGGR